MSARVVLHIPARMIAGFQNGKVPLLYGRIWQTLNARGVDLDMADGFDPAQSDDGNLHIVENGRLHQSAVLNAATAYLEGFFHVDPTGIQAASRIGKLRYDPDQIDGAAALTYFAALQRRFTLPRHSRYKQTRVKTTLPEGAIAVFLQGPAPVHQKQHHLGFEAMLLAACMASEGRVVLVKPHPLKPDYGREIIAAVRAKGFSPIETEANVHDILDAASVTVSLNSAAAIEGMLHGKPAVLCGKSDFHHFAETATSPKTFPEAMQRALTSKRDYAKALYWYFGQNCLDIRDDSFDARLLAIFAEAGFDAARLGLSG